MKDCGEWILKCLDCSHRREATGAARNEVILQDPAIMKKKLFPISKKAKPKKEFALTLYKCERIIENNPTEYDSFRPRLSKLSPYKESNEKVLTSLQKTPSLSTFSELEYTPEKGDENYYRFH